MIITLRVLNTKFKIFFPGEGGGGGIPFQTIISGIPGNPPWGWGSSMVPRLLDQLSPLINAGDPRYLGGGGGDGSGPGSHL